MNKKGFQLLSEETLKIVIAVICIVFLVYILVSLYFSVTGAQETKYAQANINGDNGVAKEISRINVGGTPNEQGFLIPNPNGWHVFSFVGQDKKPNLCTNANCICICRNILIDIFDRQIKECDSKGACAVVSNLEKFNKIKIENSGVFLSIRKVNNLIEITKK